MQHFKKLALLSLAILVLITARQSASAQGSVKIQVVTTVPAACNANGNNSPVMWWKVGGINPGFYTCVGGVPTYQTNTFGAGLTPKTMLYASATPATITSTAAPTDGQLLIGDTSDVPALATLTGTANETLITNGAHSITIGLAATLNHKVGTSFNFLDPSDTTKAFQFVASGITAGQTRTVTIPDSNTIVPIASQILTFSGPTAARTITLPDGNTSVPSSSQTLTFSGPTAARTITLFDANFTAARRDNFNAQTNVVAPATPAAGITNTWTDATDKNLKAIDDAGVITQTVAAKTAVDSLVVNGMSSAGVLSTTTAEVRLSTTASVDMNTATATTLYTCPSGRSCVITKVVVRNASTSLTTASYSFGWEAVTFANVIANATHTELTGATLYTQIDAKAGATLGTSTGTFKVLMNTLQGGAATTTIDVFGYTF